MLARYRCFAHRQSSRRGGNAPSASHCPNVMTQKKILISINAAWNIVNFRRGLIAGLREAGYEVIALAPPDAYADRVRALGVEFVPLAMDRKGVSPARDLLLLIHYYRALRRIRPDIFLGFTAKPNIYGSSAARWLGIATINNVSGLGTAFIRGGLLQAILTWLYRIAFRGSATIFFQNDDDLALFEARGIVRPGQARLLPGSGVDLDRFNPVSPIEDRAGRPFTFLLVARLLWDKGVGEYVEAARLVRQTYPDARFQLLGFLDVANRTAVPRSAVEGWAAEGLIDYLGESDDVRPFLAAADCVVLPSYREGLPRSLLEAAAMAKPLIAADVPGCRQVVAHEVNGYLCAVRDPASLAQAMLRMIALPEQDRCRLGAAGRAMVESDYDERIAVRLYLDAIREALG
jgi:glycosyltransferase involved in cell wall biosynthesis